jgi:hypothetical protein
MEHRSNRLPENLPHVWRERAAQLRDWGGSSEVAQLWERAAAELEQALQTAGGQTLTLKEAAEVCGLTTGYLGDMVRAGKLPNAGRKHAPRVRRGDLPAAKAALARPPQRSRSRPQITDIASRLH